ncbi:Zinc finger BED domain-containing protein RICESLEEPER 4, partial [Pseudolycoriella hygida]
DASTNEENDQDEAVESGHNVNVNESQDNANDETQNRNEDDSADEHAKWSYVWGHFTLVTEDNGNRYVLCNHCRKSNSSTGNMKRHLLNKHPEQLDDAQKREPEPFTFSQEKFRKALLNWVIECNQPFTEPQQQAFVALIRTLNPDAVVVSSCKSDLLAAYAAALDNLKAELAKIPGKISITMDAWTSTNSLAFLATRVTVDNASNNDTFFDCLQQHGITAVDNHMRCMAHIINLSIQDILNSLKIPYDANYHDYEITQDDLEDEKLRNIGLTQH